MGVVYRAEDEKLRRPVALKVLPPDLVGNEEKHLRFLREARAAAAVAHPNILSAIIRDAAVPPSRINPEVPADLERIINECLEKDPQDRYQHADQFAVDLRRLKRSSDSGAQAVRSPGTGIAAVPRAGWFGLSGTRTRRLALTGTPAGLLAAIGTGLWWSTRAPAGFRSGDRILVADFENATGRPEFDTAIREAFEEMTASSSFLRVIRGEPLSELMTRKAGGAVSRIDSRMADRLCGGGDCAGYLAGRIAPEGTGYRLEAGFYRAADKRAAVSRSAVAPSGDDILKAIFEIVIELRRSVGENPQSISAAAPPTTRSLSAYRAFAVANRQGDMGAGIDLYKQALQIDPDFVEAYANLAVTYVNSGDWREYLRYAKEAHRRSTDLPAQHREWNEVLFLEASYDFDAEIQRLKGSPGSLPERPAISRLARLALQQYVPGSRRRGDGLPDRLQAGAGRARSSQPGSHAFCPGQSRSDRSPGRRIQEQGRAG